MNPIDPEQLWQYALSLDPEPSSVTAIATLITIGLARGGMSLDEANKLVGRLIIACSIEAASACAEEDRTGDRNSIAS